MPCQQTQASLRPSRVSYRGLWLAAIIAAHCHAATDAAEPTERTFELTYAAELTEIPAGHLQVWLPVAESDEYQTVIELDERFPVQTTRSRDTDFGNLIQSFSIEISPNQNIRFHKAYRILRRTAQPLKKKPAPKTRSSAQSLQRFLQPDRLVPVTGRPLELLKGVSLARDTIAKARVLYDVVRNYVRYDKSVPGYGRGDALWVCDSRTGNCTDFHSLFIALARSQQIPARFEIGFPIGDAHEGTISGYHCWASFFEPALGWVPVDISEADKNPALKDFYFGNLPPDRVRFSVGRDIQLQPPQKAPPLNFFVSPYAEIDGKPLSDEKIRLTVSYRVVDEEPDASAPATP